MEAADEANILGLLAERDAANARADAEAVFAPMADDVVSFDFPPPLQNQGKGAEGIEALNAWYQTWDGPVTVDLVDPTVHVDGTLAVVYGLGRLRGVKKGEGQIDQWNRRTIALRKDGGAWRIIHEHNSYPMRMDGTDKAAVDLKP